MAENAIEFCEITKRFGEVTASDRVSFSPDEMEQAKQIMLRHVAECVVR